MSTPPILFSKVTLVALMASSSLGASSLGLAPKRPSATSTDDCVTSIPSGEECPQDMPGIAFVFPDAEHCSRYWECFNGCANNIVCQEDYLYDDGHGWCNFPEDVSLDKT